MARTRGAMNRAGLIHVDDGEALDKDGKPLNVSGSVRQPQQRDVSASEPVVVAAPQRFICNPKTVERTMEAAELVAILDLVLGGFAVEVSREEWSAMNPNVRRHFRAVP